MRLLMRDATIEEFAASIDEPLSRVKDVLRGKQRPPADMLVKIHVRYGTDLNWLLVGEGRVGATHTTQELLLLDLYRRASERSREAILSTASALAGAASPEQPKAKTTIKQILHGDIGQHITGDVVNNGPINVGTGRARRSK